MRLFRDATTASVALNGCAYFRKRVRGGNLTRNNALRGAVEFEKPHVAHLGRNQNIRRVVGEARPSDAVLNDRERARDNREKAGIASAPAYSS
jgi:hypothetical protein